MREKTKQIVNNHKNQLKTHQTNGRKCLRSNERQTQMVTKCFAFWCGTEGKSKSVCNARQPITVLFSSHFQPYKDSNWKGLTLNKSIIGDCDRIFAYLFEKPKIAIDWLVLLLLLLLVWLKHYGKVKQKSMKAKQAPSYDSNAFFCLLFVSSVWNERSM